MQIIPVLDIARGIVVHAQAGDRSRYAVLHSGLVAHRDGDPVAVLRAFHSVLAIQECYVADLDAIQGGPVQLALLRELATSGTQLMVDAGSHLAEEALTILSCGVREVVVGLETLHAFSDLRNIVTEVGPSRVVFSLDLRLGRPILHPSMQEARENTPVDLGREAADTGVSSILVLDLARVGTGAGVDLGLIETLRKHLPDIRLLAGGGIRSQRGLIELSDAGCDGALVASAIHDGHLSAADLARVSQWGRPRDQSGTRASR